MEIAATDYIHRGNTYVLRKALNMDDPESWQSLWTNKYGTIIGFPWEDMYGEHAKEAEESYMTLMEAIKKRIPRCPHCGEFLY